MMCIRSVYYIFVFSLFIVISGASDCNKRDFGYGSFVCICNATFCDFLQPIKSVPLGEIVQIVSNKKAKRWLVTENKFRNYNQSGEEFDVIVKVNRGKKFQKILGFGGAFTDATGINIKSVPKKLQNFIMRGYFSEEGLEYNLGRVPIGGSDFSTHPYSYDDLTKGQVDPSLKHFALRMEDFEYKIPYILEAQELCEERKVNLKLFSSPWSGPGWMKSNGKINGNGKLLKKYYSTWAAYLIRFLNEYQKHNITFMGLTTQNEPSASIIIQNFPYNTMGWLPEEQAEWIGHHLGPQLQESGHQNVTIFALDDHRVFLPDYMIKIMDNKKASKYVGGIAVHFYLDTIAPARLLEVTHDYFPNLPILYTEACTGSKEYDLLHVIPGSWSRAESYAWDIIQNLQHWVVGWTDWNLALNPQGGPNWVENFVDSPIIVNQVEEEIMRQPMFYALAHFSKVLPEGSVRIDFQVSGKKNQEIFTTCLMRPDQTLVLIALNKNPYSVTLEIKDSGRSFATKLDSCSISSFIWRI